MKASETSVNVQISDKARAFIKSRRLANPIILVNLSTRSSQGGSDSCGGGSGSSCGGGGGDSCGGGGSSYSPPVNYVNTIIVDGGQPGPDFIKVDTAAGIPVYLAKKAYDIALKGHKTLIIDVKGMIMKKLTVEGLDLT